MRAIELFAGIGGFRLGLERAGHEVIWANEWDKYACDVYDKNFFNQYQATGATPLATGDSTDPSSLNVERATQDLSNNRGHKIDRRDITTIPAHDIPAHDLIVGGFPCQAFSVAGKRQGFDETRGTLFFDILRIARYHRTPYLMLENVKGLLSHDKGRTFEIILEALDESGYDIQWQVLNSKNFGVPQNRERIIIIGHLRSEPRPEVFPLTKADNQNNKSEPDGKPGTQGIATRHLNRNGSLISPIASTVQVAEIPHIIQLNQPTHSNDRVYGADGISPTLDTMQGGRRQPFISKTIRVGGGKSPHGSKQNWDSYEVDGRIRRLTPTECERLQAFPDNWTKYGLKLDGTEYEVSDTQRYKMCGNAVTTNVIEAVARKL